jgi:hypothetical protein
LLLSAASRFHLYQGAAQAAEYDPSDRVHEDIRESANEFGQV